MKIRTSFTAAIATNNPIKVSGARSALRPAPVRRIPGPEGPKLPRGLSVIVRLARRRARLAARVASMGVGVESGLDRLGVITACVVRYRGRESVGFGPVFRLPPGGLPPRTKIDQAGGVVALLSGGRFTRRHLVRDAVLMALLGLP